MIGQRKFRPYIRKGTHIAGEGPTSARVMLIGDRPGKQDDQAGRLYAGIAGHELARYLSSASLTRADFYITNLVKDYRDGEPPEDWEIARDSITLEEEISVCCPEIIVPMGKYAIQHFLGDIDVEIVHGVPHWSGYDVLPDGNGGHGGRNNCIVMPTFHPAAGFYDPETQPQIIDDFRRLAQVIGGELTPIEDEFPTPNYYQLPGSFNPYISQPAFDTEGSKKSPWGMSACDRPGIAMVIKASDKHGLDWTNFRIETGIKEMGNEFYVWLHNSLHDLQVLNNLGIRIPEDRFLDTMVLAYVLCIEPQGLKSLAYRHAGMKMKSYDEVTGPYHRAVMQEYIFSAADLSDLPESEEYVIIEKGQPKIKKPWGIARHIKRLLNDYEKDDTIDLAKRWDNIEDYKKESVVSVLGPPPEQDLDYVPDEEAVDYSARDADATKRIGPRLLEQVVEKGLWEVAKLDHAIIPMVDRMQRTGMLADPEYFDRLGEECTGELGRLQSEISQMTGATINCDSGDQVAALIFDQLKLPIGKLTQGGERGSTNDKILEGLRFTHPVMPLIMDSREISKVRNSFCRPIARASRASIDRRVRCQIRLTRVSSGRPSATKPNLLAIPVRTTLGKRVRKGFVAKEGCVLGNWDFDQMEMRFMAHESADPFLIELFNDSRRDVHSEIGALMFGIHGAKADNKYSGVDKLKHRYPAKRVGFGVITGITAVGLVDQMKLANATKNGKPLGLGGEPWTESDCQEMIDEYFKICKGVKVYIDNCRAEARRFESVRESVSGRIRLLPGVHSTVPWIREEALRQSHSHKIQSGAQSIMKKAMIPMWEWIKIWWGDGIYVEPLLQIYDSVLMEVQSNATELVDESIQNCMKGAYQLRVPLSAKGGFGPNWGEIEEK